MPQAIAETVFDIFYLGFALSAGLAMLFRGKTLSDVICQSFCSAEYCQ